MVLFRVSGATWGLLVVPAAYAIAQIVNVWHADRLPADGWAVHSGRVGRWCCR
jgi:hypothetical protein